MQIKLKKVWLNSELCTMTSGSGMLYNIEFEKLKKMLKSNKNTTKDKLILEKKIRKLSPL